MSKNEKISIDICIEEDAMIPCYSTPEAAGADIRAYLQEDVVVEPGASVLIPTGLRFAIPEGYEIQVRPRSGLALKHGLTVLNSPGTIDSDYRGELKVILINHGQKPFTIEPGMRIAQIIVAPVFQAHFVNVKTLAATQRQEQGFGHTGLN